MRRSRTYPVTPVTSRVANDATPDESILYQSDDEGSHAEANRQESHLHHSTAESTRQPSRVQNHIEASSSAAALVHNIASFLTLSDAASLTSFVVAGGGSTSSPADSWAVGVELDGDHASWSPSNMETPQTPALVAVSPGATPFENIYNRSELDNENAAAMTSLGDSRLLASFDKDCESPDDSDRMEALFHDRRRQWAQEKITSAVFSHPKSLRSFCWDAYVKAKEIRMQKQQAATFFQIQETPETHIEPTGKSGIVLVRKRKKASKPMDLRSKIIHEVIDWIFHRVPVSVLLDVLEASGMTVADTTGASCIIAISSIQHAVAALGSLVCAVWDTATHCVTNPFQVLEAIISLQFNAMGKTSEVLVSGIQSVATGVGSASGLALYRLSATANMSSSASLVGHGNRKSAGSTPGDGKSGVLNKRLLHRLSAINDAALVVEYREREEDTCGLTRHAVSRTRRMMHYSVSLRPFVATLTLPYSSPKDQPSFGAENLEGRRTESSFETGASETTTKGSSPSSSPEDDEYSPFMCTPQSYPPTPNSRRIVLLQRSALSDDVVFLAIDRLRVHEGLESDNELTRERSQALEVSKRLAIFACDKDSGIELTCGRHIATKCGNTYYASARSMIAVLRNCFVYFEISVLPQPVSPVQATLSIGLSTEEMPPNTLVGAWQSSVGLCTTGQILMAGQWCSPADPAKFAYGVGSTVGCLVCLDNESAFETWDGVMVKATIRFIVNGVVVSPPVSTLPMNGTPHLSAGSPTSPSTGSSSGDRTSPGHGSSRKRVDSPDQPSPTLSLLVPSVEELYPTVTLQSPSTSVVCRFSSADVMASTREVIGAPPGVAVYAIDGSIILNANEDESSSLS
jgi:hypothetical protein